MAANSRELLSDAIARNCGLVISLPSAGLLRHHKSRFLREDSAGFWVDASFGELSLIRELTASQKPVGLSFKSGVQKIIFTSPILEFNPECRINTEIVLPALHLPFPTQIKAIQRRNNYRVRVYGDCDLRARVWRIAGRAYIGDRPQASQEVAVTPRDLSLGGMGVTIAGQEGKPPKISMEDRLRIELRFGDVTMLLEGRMRQPAGPQPPNGIHTGIQFKEMASDLEGRQKISQLTRILGEMQREEARRARLGIA